MPAGTLRWINPENKAHTALFGSAGTLHLEGAFRAPTALCGARVGGIVSIMDTLQTASASFAHILVAKT